MTKVSFPAFDDFKMLTNPRSDAYRLGKPPKELVFMAMHHTNNPADPAYATLNQAFIDFRPQIALHESYDWPIEGDTNELIRHYGESAYMCRLARDAGIPYESAEPGRDVETKEYKAKYGDKLVAAFYVFRQVWQYHRQQIKAPTFEAETRAHFETWLKQAGLDFSWSDLDAISQHELNVTFNPDDERVMRRYRQATDPTHTGSVFNEIANYTGYVRDKAIFDKITRLKRQYDRIFIVMGSSHYYTLEPYLKQLYS